MNSSSSTPINPFTVDLRHPFRPKCLCESCTRTRIAAMKDGDILLAHYDRLDKMCRDALEAKRKTQTAEYRRLQFINEIIAAAGVLHISH